MSSHSDEDNDVFIVYDGGVAIAVVSYQQAAVDICSALSDGSHHWKRYVEPTKDKEPS
jgi:hypothetical protein